MMLEATWEESNNMCIRFTTNINRVAEGETPRINAEMYATSLIYKYDKSLNYRP
jgi:hypothetical protein